jgi:cytochrome b involved in lipid metabolism
MVNKILLRVIGVILVIIIIGLIVFLPKTSTYTNDTNTYSLEDVSNHNTQADCWTIINNKVYNITEFIPNHPGGPVILQACGGNGTVLFETRGDKNSPHPSTAQEKLETMYIGDLE